MSLFYAYLKNINDDWSGRYLIVFATREVADEWWRAVSTSKVGYYAASLQRVTPQFYTHNTNLVNASTSITIDGVAKQFLGQVIFTLLEDRDSRIWNVIPPIRVTDHISGRWYYIRSKSDSNIYWHCIASGAVVASTTASTRFFVRNVDETLKDAVLINSDSIHLSFGNLFIGVNSSGSLQAEGKADAFKFGSFIDGFRINGRGASALPSVADGVIVQSQTGDGEPWELTTSGLL